MDEIHEQQYYSKLIVFTDAVTLKKIYCTRPMDVDFFRYRYKEDDTAKNDIEAVDIFFKSGNKISVLKDTSTDYLFTNYII